MEIQVKRRKKYIDRPGGVFSAITWHKKVFPLAIMVEKMYILPE